MRRQTRFTGISPAVWKECYDRDGGMGIPTNLVMLCPDCHREMDQGDGKEIKREMREYLQSIYPLWDEEKQRYTKGTGR